MTDNTLITHFRLFGTDTGKRRGREGKLVISRVNLTVMIREPLQELCLCRKYTNTEIPMTSGNHELCIMGNSK
jgi:hypothetical protein